jgi:anti-anti-sigma factor
MAAKASPIKTQVSDGTLRLNPKGDIVASTVESLRDALLTALEEATGPVVLDLASTKQIDSLGITLVLGLFKTCQKKQLGFAIEGVSPDILRVFRLFNLTKFFPVKEASGE